MLWLHFTAMEINNLFKIGDSTDEARIAIAKELAIAVLKKHGKTTPKKVVFFLAKINKSTLSPINRPSSTT